MTNSVTLAARRARISRQAIYEHRKADAEFAKQWDEAVEHAIDMLHARAFQRALEGDCEPVFYMGVPVAYPQVRLQAPDRNAQGLRAGAIQDAWTSAHQHQHRAELARANRGTAR